MSLIIEMLRHKILFYTHGILGEALYLVPVDGGTGLVDELAEEALETLKVSLNQLQRKIYHLKRPLLHVTSNSREDRQAWGKELVKRNTCMNVVHINYKYEFPLKQYVLHCYPNKLRWSRSASRNDGPTYL